MLYSNEQIKIIKSELTPIHNRELLSMYEDMLDDCYGEVNICGYLHSASQAFKKVDLVAFELSYSDWLSFELGQTLVEIGDEYYNLSEVENLLDNRGL